MPQGYPVKYDFNTRSFTEKYCTVCCYITSFSLHFPLLSTWTSNDLIIFCSLHDCCRVVYRLLFIDVNDTNRANKCQILLGFPQVVITQSTIPTAGRISWLVLFFFTTQTLILTIIIYRWKGILPSCRPSRFVRCYSSNNSCRDHSLFCYIFTTAACYSYWKQHLHKNVFILFTASLNWIQKEM